MTLSNGGAGADRLDGGAGIDTASYSAATDGVTVDLDPHRSPGQCGRSLWRCSDQH